jgi:hypothetical protein
MKINDNDKDEINNYSVTSTINICNLYEKEFSKSIKGITRSTFRRFEKKWPRLYAMF